MTINYVNCTEFLWSALYRPVDTWGQIVYTEREDEVSHYRNKQHKTRWILFHLGACVYTVAYIYWLRFTPATHVFKRLKEDPYAERLYIKYVYGQVHSRTTSRVRNDCKLSKVDDTSATVSLYDHNDVKLYPPRTLTNERDEELLLYLEVVLRS